MGRTSKIIGFSLPPEISAQLEAEAKLTHKTRSEMLREMIERYFEKPEPQDTSTKQALPETPELLAEYWKQRSLNARPPIIIGLLLLQRPERRQLLICQRTEPDTIVQNLTWAFPGGRLTSLDFLADLAQIAQEKLGIAVDVQEVIAARVIPDATGQDVVALYFKARALTTFARPNTDFYSKTKWVAPLDVFQYFTTSVSDEVTKYLKSI